MAGVLHAKNGYNCLFISVSVGLWATMLVTLVYHAEKAMHPTPVLLPGKSHGRRSLVGCHLWGRTELDTTERLHFHFSLWCIGEGNGNPLQCSCLENPRDGGAWWAAVYGVAQRRTRLKRLSSSSSSTLILFIHTVENVPFWQKWADQELPKCDFSGYQA